MFIAFDDVVIKQILNKQIFNQLSFINQSLASLRLTSRYPFPYCPSLTVIHMHNSSPPADVDNRLTLKPLYLPSTYSFLKDYLFKSKST